MRRSIARGFVLGILLSVAVALSAVAHQGEDGASIQAEPAAVTAGDTTVLAGSGLEPDDERILVLAGEDLSVDLGTATTDGEGMLSVEIEVPAHLPSGTYELRAIGDETLTTTLAVTATAPSAGSPAADTTADGVVARTRLPIELGGIVVFVAAAALAGGWLIWRAERFRGPTAA